MAPCGIESLPDGSGARVVLADGRVIGVRETGAPDGWPLFVFPGTPGSRLCPLGDLEGTRQAGARVFVLERPGFGVSTTTELALVARPWGFRLEDIRVPVHIWHGDLDVSTPLAME